MTPILHVQLAGEPGGELRLRLWSGDPAGARERPLALEEVAHLVERPEADYQAPLPATLRNAGRSLFRWLDGDGRWLSAAVEAWANEAAVLVLALDVPPALAHLPWEALHDGTGFLVDALNPPVLPVRWRASGAAARAPANRPLQALFMASSPCDVQPVLDHEKEEHDLLAATGRAPLDLVVEESGSLGELGALMRDYGAGFFDVLHLTGHAGHADDGTPVFRFENGEGRRADATAPALARALPDRPPLVVLAAFHTGHRGPAPLAGELVAAGFPAVLAWDGPAHHAGPTLAAGHAYAGLAAGESLPLALVRAHVRVREAGARDWHRLRLFCAGSPPGALVTPPMTPGRLRPGARPAESEFLDPRERTVKVATRAAFVGRRRLLEQCVRVLRRPDPFRVGVLLHGQGGRGKSSVAARLCDRLRRELRRVVVIGRLDEPSLVGAWTPELADHDARRALLDPAEPLRYRIETQLRRAADAGEGVPLFVLDDFEQNQPRVADGDLELAPHAADALMALLQALEHTGTGRVLITGRYLLPEPFAGFLQASPLPPLDPAEQEKQSRRLGPGAGAAHGDPALLAAVRDAADGNPRLSRWLHRIVSRTELGTAGILAALREAEEEFRAGILARFLVASLPEPDRAMLGRMLLVPVAVPLAAVRALEPSRPEAELRQALEGAFALGLADVTHEDGEPHYRVPRQLAAPGLLSPPGGVEAAALAGAVFDVLFPSWAEGGAPDDRRAVELVRLGALAGRTAALVALAASATSRWLAADRLSEARSLLEEVLEPGGRHPSLLLNLALAAEPLGDADAAGELLREAESACSPGSGDPRARVLFHLGRWLIRRGETKEAMRIYRERLLPTLDPAGDAHLRALTLRTMADVLHRYGEGDEALRTLRADVLPAFERLGDARECAATLGEIADVLHARGEMDEALRIRRHEQLPACERLGELRARAEVLGRIADVLHGRGEVDEALRIRCEEQLPVYERLGDVRSRAVVLGKVADARYRRGELDEALRIRREQLPVFEHLGDVRSRAVALGKIADILNARGAPDEVLRIRREQIAIFEHVGDVRGRAVAVGKIADVLWARGELDEALRIRLEEQLPVFERLDDARAQAKTMGKIADLLRARGEVSEALRIRLEEQLPVFERLGDVHARAVVRGKVADALFARGEVDEALRIRRDEQLPVFREMGDVRHEARAMRKIAALLRARGEPAEALRTLRRDVIPVADRSGDMRELVKGRAAVAELLLDGGREEDVPEAREHLAWSHQAAASRGYRDVARVEKLIARLEVPVLGGA